MTSSRAGIHAALNRQASRAREANQAQPRPARVRFAVKTQGIGESRLVGASAIGFGANMLEEPTFSWGVISLDPLKTGELPMCTATVLNWKKSAQGLWVGAEVGFKIESMLFTVRLKFTLTFEGSTLRTTSGQGTDTITAPTSNDYKGQTTYTQSQI